MHSILNNKFLQLFKKLIPKEQKSFDTYLKGFYSTQKIQLSIFDYVYKVAPDFKDVEWLELDNVFEAVFHKPLQQPKDRKNILNAFSDLTRWLENFLLSKKLEENSFERTYLLQRIYQDFDLTKNYSNAIEKSYKGIEAKKKQLLELFLLNELVYFDIDKEADSIPIKHLEDGMEQLNQFYMLKKLKYKNEIASRSKVLNESTKKLNERDDLLKLPDSLLTATATHEIYWLQYQLNSPSGIIKQQQAYEALKKRIYDFSLGDKQLHHISLIYAGNYAAQQFRSGSIQFRDEAFELYKFGLEEDILIINDIFPKEPFLSMVNIACVQEKFDWARDFLETYTKLLPTAFRQDSYHIGRARIYFGQKKYTKAHKFLSRINFRHLKFQIQASLLSILCLVEIKHLNKFQIEISKFQGNISNLKGLPLELVNQLIYFTEIAQQFVQRDISKNMLTQKLEQQPTFPYKDWFLEKLNQM